MKPAACLPFLALSLAVAGCDKKDSAPPQPASADVKPAGQAGSAPAAATSGAAAGPTAGQRRLSIATGKASFLIDAPLEKIKGETSDAKGFIDLDSADLTRSKGEVSFRLSTLKTATFGDKGKDESQTEHAQNWMEVGKEATAEKRAKFEWATFKLKSVSTSTPKLADVKEDGGARSFDAKLTGTLELHGVSSEKTFTVKVVAKGPADAPTELSLTTSEAWPVSLKEHGIMPRDGVGSFLQGALERIGKKIDDKVQISLAATAK